MQRQTPKVVTVCMGALFVVIIGTAAQAQDERVFAAHALAFRSAAVDGTNATTEVLATMPGAGPAKALPLLWRPFFENAIVKLGRVRASAPVALYYNPLVDLALVTFWERRGALYRIVSIRALPGERLDDPGAPVPEYPGWLAADDPVAALAGTAHERLSAFRRAHPAEALDAGRDEVTFRAAASDMHSAQPRFTWLLAMRTQWAAGTAAWLPSALAAIDEVMAAGNAGTVLAGAPDTDAETAAALAALPARYADGLTLDLTLEADGSERLLIASSVHDRDIYVLVLCRLEASACALRRLSLLSLSAIRAPG